MNFKLLTTAFLGALVLLTYSAEVKAANSPADFPTGKPYYFHTWTYGKNGNDPDCWTMPALVDTNQPCPPALPMLLSHGVSKSELMKWAPFIITRYCEGGKPADGCKGDVNVNVGDLKSWIKSGIDPKRAIAYDKHGMTIQGAIELDPVIKRRCKGTPEAVLSANIMDTNPYAARGKCYIVGGTIAQVVNSRTALILNAKDFWQVIQTGIGSYVGSSVLMVYSTGYAPSEDHPTLVLAKGEGVFKYEATSGEKKVVPKLTTLYDLNK